MRVKFTKHCQIYMPGETAHFPEDEARALIKAKAAISAELEPKQDEIADAAPDELAVEPEPEISAPVEETPEPRKRKRRDVAEVRASVGGNWSKPWTPDAPETDR